MSLTPKTASGLTSQHATSNALEAVDAEADIAWLASPMGFTASSMLAVVRKYCDQVDFTVFVADIHSIR